MSENETDAIQDRGALSGREFVQGGLTQAETLIEAEKWIAPGRGLCGFVPVDPTGDSS
jgi:hypothetical protein